MEPKREPGDDRTMWKIRPLAATLDRHVMKPNGPWAICGTAADAIDTIEGGDLDSPYEIRQVVVTAEEWNAMPEFDGF